MILTQFIYAFPFEYRRSVCGSSLLSIVLFLLYALSRSRDNVVEVVVVVIVVVVKVPDAEYIKCESVLRREVMCIDNRIRMS